MRKILIDISFLFDQYYLRGIGRYGIEIGRRLIEKGVDENIKIHLLGYGDLQGNLSRLGMNDRKSFNPKIYFHSLGPPQLSKPLTNLYNYYFKIRPLVKRIQPDLFFAMLIDRGLPSDLAPTAVAIHDIIPLITGEYSKRNAVVNFLKGVFYRHMWDKAKNAQLVFTSSNFSKKDLMQYGKISENRTHVIYLGISEIFRDSSLLGNEKLVKDVMEKFSLRRSKYLFYDAGFEPNKNTDRLLEILAEILKKIPGIKLVTTGRNEMFLRKASSLGIDKQVVNVGRITEKELALLTANAMAYINLSNYEGFGFGPLQAMAMGTLAIVSNRSCFPEISGQAALVVDPDNVSETSQQVINILGDGNMKQDLIRKGLEHSKKFNWDDAFKQTWMEIERVI